MTEKTLPSPDMAAKIAKALSEEFESLEAYLQALHEILSEGHMPDIADLGNRVTRVCTAIENADKDTQKQYKGRLDALLGKLDNCEKEIRAFQARRGS